MSDELMIQPQVIQPQKKDNSLLYATGAGLVGGAGGYYAAKNWTGKITTHDDIIKDVKDQVDLSTKYQNVEEATVKGVTDAAKEVKEAEAAVEAAKKPVLAADAPEQKAYDEAKSAYDTAFSKFKEEKLSTFKAQNGKIDIVNPRFEVAENLTNEVLAAPDGFKDPSGRVWKDPRTWFASDRTKAIREYNRLTGNIERRAQDLRANLERTGQPLALINEQIHPTGTPTATTSIRGLFDSFAHEYETRTNKDIFQKLIKDPITSNESLSPCFDNAQRLAQRLYPDHLGTLDASNLEQYLQFGEHVTTRPSGGIPYGHHYEAITGTMIRGDERLTGYIHYTDDQLKEFNKVKRQEFIDQTLAQGERYAKAVANNTDAKRAEQLATGSFKNLSKAKSLGGVNGASLWSTTGTYIDHARLTAMTEEHLKADVEALQDLVDQGKKKIGSTSLNGEYYMVNADGTIGAKVKNPNKALEMAEARLSYVRENNQLKKEAEQAIRECMSDNPYMRTLDERVAKEAAAFEPLQEALTKYSERFPKLNTGASIPADAEEKAVKYAEGKTGELKKAMEEKLGILDKAKAEKGTANQEAIKKAQEALNGKMSALEDKAKALAEKLPKVGGLNKWLGAGIGLAALGLAGYMIGKPSDS